MEVWEVGDRFGLELLQVAGFVLGLAVFPAAEEDADPFEGHGADGGVMAVSAGPEVVVEGLDQVLRLRAWSANSWNVCKCSRNDIL